jgi:hypothetical protein
MNEQRPAYHPCNSQRQADVMEHAAHDPEYALSMSVPEAVAQGCHAADIAAGLWGKTTISLCVKCVQAAAKATTDDIPF